MRAMNRARTITALLAAAVLLAGCGGPSYDESIQQCMAAVEVRYLDDKTKPKACEPITDKDYNVINMHKTLRDAGLITPTPSP